MADKNPEKNPVKKKRTARGFYFNYFEPGASSAGSVPRKTSEYQSSAAALSECPSAFFLC